MDKLTWREPSKTVALTDIVYRVNSLILFGALFVLNIIVGFFPDVALQIIPCRLVYPMNYYVHMHKSTTNANRVWVSVGVGLAIFLNCALCRLQLWAARKLLNATDTGNQPQKAFTKSYVYRNVTIIFFFVAVFISAAVFAAAGWFAGLIALSPLIITIIFRVVAFSIVCNFSDELDRLNNSKLETANIAGVKVFR